MKPSYKTLFKSISTFIFDVDGVMTDSSVQLIGEDMVRTMSTRDGWALQHAVKQGFNVCVISGGRSENVRKRMEYLGVTDVFLGVGAKMEVYDKYLTDHNITAEQVLYMGDDLPDYHVMLKSGIASCPNDATEEIKSIANYVSPKDGGKGAVRDVIEQTMKMHGVWFDKNS
jgi:3-deoxy-D-manno-octulosonate 8-phosphate phosphatase (KDO 8-P phosphatase)